jgi:hypothetical protein
VASGREAFAIEAALVLEDHDFGRLRDDREAWRAGPELRRREQEN